MAELGAPTVARLHRLSPGLEWTAMATAFAAFVTLAVLAGRLPFGPALLGCVVAQGFVLQHVGTGLLRQPPGGLEVTRHQSPLVGQAAMDAGRGCRARCR